MPRTQMPTAGVLSAEHTGEAALAGEPEDFDPPSTRVPEEGEGVPLSYRERLERAIVDGELAMLPLKDKMRKYMKTRRPSDALTESEQRLFLAHQDSLRKIQATLSQIESREKDVEVSDVSTALMLYDAGDSFESICEQMSFNPQLPKLLREALDERERKNA